MVRIVLALALVGAVVAAAEGPRPGRWVEPVTLEGVENLHRVTDTLYRSAQPSEVGMRNLERLGVRKVINLRAFHSDDDEAAGTRLGKERLHVSTWRVEDEDVVRVLRLVTDPKNGPYLIHCQHGADRTGLMCAMYRVVVQNWSKDEAVDEMVNGGFGFHQVWRNLVEYVRGADVAKFRAAVTR